MARRKRKNLGLAPADHVRDARNWRDSSGHILSTAEAILQRNPCGAIEHYTDAIAEGTVAEVQFQQAGMKSAAEAAQRFVSHATRRQRQAVRLCRRAR